MKVLETFRDSVAALSGMRAQLVEAGWSDQEARSLILMMFAAQAGQSRE
jgi:hypothetical protein